MLFHGALFSLSLAIFAFGASFQNLSRSGSQLSAFAHTDCSDDALATVKDLPNDGVQGTNCLSTKAVQHTDGTYYRNLIQSIQTTNLQNGCTAYAYSGPSCDDNHVIQSLTSNQCQNLSGLAESIKVICIKGV